MTTALPGSRLRLTPQRRLVWEILQATGHATAERIAAQVQERAPGVSVATVYRTLRRLEELGLVTATAVAAGPRLYEIRPEQRPHYHALCSRCGAVVHLPADATTDSSLRSAARAAGFHVEHTLVTVVGLCPVCQAAP